MIMRVRTRSSQVPFNPVSEGRPRVFGISHPGSLKLLSHDTMERRKGRNGILSNLGSCFLSADMMPLRECARARSYACVSVCHRQLAQVVLLDCSTPSSCSQRV